MDNTGQVRIADEVVLMEARYQGAGELAAALRDKVYNPDFYTVERTDDYSGDCDVELHKLCEVVEEIRAARAGGCCHLCVQAHWLLSGGRGEASITLILED
jgi:hypothetical protein